MVHSIRFKHSFTLSLFSFDPTINTALHSLHSSCALYENRYYSPSPLYFIMRLIKRNDDDEAATEAMRGGAIGAFKYCTVALFAGGVLNAVSPRFRAIKAPQKV